MYKCIVFLLKQLRKNNEAHRPQLTHLSEIATADVMSPNPVIATNERIIIWADHGFEEDEGVFLLSLFYNIWAWQWSVTIWTNF